MSAAAILGRRTLRFANIALDTAVLGVIMLMIAVGYYALWDSRQVIQMADSARYAIYKPTIENEGKTFQELQAINPEVFAWLTIYGTNIDYPVVQCREGNNLKYINTSAEGRYSLSGAIFLDVRSSPDFSDFSSILHGHHMDKNAMFGQIEYFVQRSYFDARRYGMLYYDGQEYGLEFFAFVHADAYDASVFRTRIQGRENQQAYLDLLLDIAINTRDIPVTPDDRIVLLNTCSGVSTNGRDILIGRITDVLYEDPFIVEETDDRNILAIDRLPGLWAQAPIWVKIIAISSPFIALLFLLSFMINNRKRSPGRNH